MSIGDDVKDVAVAAVGAAAGAAVKEFLAKNPDVEQKVTAAKDLLEEALKLIPEDELHRFLRPDDAHDAETAFKLMRAMKLAAYAP